MLRELSNPGMLREVQVPEGCQPTGGEHGNTQGTDKTVTAPKPLFLIRITLYLGSKMLPFVWQSFHGQGAALRPGSFALPQTQGHQRMGVYPLHIAAQCPAHPSGFWQIQPAPLYIYLRLIIPVTRKPQAVGLALIKHKSLVPSLFCSRVK